MAWQQKLKQSNAYRQLRKRWVKTINAEQPRWFLQTRLAYMRMLGKLVEPAPTFLGIGAQRAGTSSLHNYLNQNPQILLPRYKEMHYFDGYMQANRPVEWYQLKFCVWGGKRTRDIRAAGEITPEYMYLPDVIERIHQFDPNLKLLVMLRNPADRAISGYSLRQSLNPNGVLPLAESMEREEELIAPGTKQHYLWHGYKARGRYVEQLDRVFQYFPREQVHIERLEDMQSDPNNTLRRITDFLGVEPIDLSSHPIRNKLPKPPNDEVAEVRAKLITYFEPYNQALAEKYGIRVDDWI